jgi:hypothetical protein
MARVKRITLFQWGYEGWGSSTQELVAIVDATERQAGFEPPIFADIRYSRSVRAAGFRDKAFADQLGHVRYRWLRSLGNAAIGTRGRMRIQCPDAAHQLLDLALDAAEARRRVIFFCSCPSAHGAKWCHRATVAKLVLRAARSRGVHVTVQEWPGGSPIRAVAHSLRTSDEQLRKMRAGATSVPLTSKQAFALAGTPIGTLVELVAPAGKQVLSVAPPQYRGGGWQLPLFLFPVEEGDTQASLLRFVDRERKRSNLDARQT